MELTILLGKVFSLYLIITGLGLLLNKAHYQKSPGTTAKKDIITFPTSIVTLIIGITLVVVHSVWVAAWPVIVTILAYVTFIKGALDTVFPTLVIKLVDGVSKDSFYYFSVLFNLGVGGYLAMMAFAL